MRSMPTAWKVSSMSAASRPDLVGKHDYSCQFVVNSDSYHRRFSGYTLA
ncbi:Uncharacterised protein [Brucella anthropi]|nr:Uncharacterised protein [Brucella anthropi]